MAYRTYAVGDIHGDLTHLKRALAKLPPTEKSDSLVFLGDYIDRGPDSAGVVDFLKNQLPKQTEAKIVTLRGNHEDGWLRVASGGWPEFIMPLGNGCLATLRSYTGTPHKEGDFPTEEELILMQSGDFFPPDVINWFNTLPYWYEDDYAIYVHAGLVEHKSTRDTKAEKSVWVHPMDTANPTELLWLRTMRFFKQYSGKQVVCGHTTTDNLPPELSSFTPDIPNDMWVNGDLAVIDTGCGKDGFLTVLELPSMKVYEST